MYTLPYRVEHDLFTGPLDLLLYLVRRNEVDILDLPVAELTSQFQRFLDVLGTIDIDLAGDFIVMASTLTEIKSRLVLPRTEEPIEPELDVDPRSDLIHQLLEYRKFRDAARTLEQRAAEWQERYPRLSNDRPLADRDVSHDRIKEVELWDLVSALERVLKNLQSQEEAKILYDDTPIAVYTKHIGDQVRAEGRVAFTSLFGDTTIRSKIIGMFLAVLELLRHQKFRAEQTTAYGEIWILPPQEPAPDSATDSSPHGLEPTANDSAAEIDSPDDSASPPSQSNGTDAD